MKKLKSAFVLVGCVVLATAAWAGKQVDRVVAIQTDGVLQLAQAGKVVLADVVYPDPALAERVLAQHMLQHEIAYEAGEEDRYGRLRIAGDMQAIMLREGAALLVASSTPPVDWRAAEQEARAAKRGVWGQPGFVLAPEEAAQHVGEFHVVEGTIVRLYSNKSATYVNFGADWHTDFSIAIAGRARREADKLALKAGDRLAVRGMIYQENGPMIRIGHATQLEKR